MKTYEYGWSQQNRQRDPKYVNAADEKDARRKIRERFNLRSTRGIVIEEFTAAGMTEDNHAAVAASEVAAMRAWLADCQWQDIDGEDILGLPDRDILDSVDRHYDGGLVAFLRSVR